MGHEDEKRYINHCDVCQQNKKDCERKQVGYRKKFYLVCKDCQEELKLTEHIIKSTAKWLVRKKPEKFALFVNEGKIFGVTPTEAIT